MMEFGYQKLEASEGISLILCLHAGIVVQSSTSRNNNTLSRTSSGNGGAPLSRTSSSNGSVQSYGSARSTGSGRSAGSGQFAPRQATSTAKTVWVWTKSKDVMTASVEGGWSTFIFTPETMDLAHEWTCRRFLHALCSSFFFMDFKTVVLADCPSQIKSFLLTYL